MRRLATVVTVVFMAMALAIPASAAPTFEVYEEEVDEWTVIPAGWWCDFEIEVHTVGTYSERWFFDKKTGEPTKAKIQFGGSDTFTGPGATAWHNFRWNVAFDAASEGEVQTGNHFSLKVPGMGLVFNESGRAEYVYETGEIFSWSGPHPWLLRDFDSLCDAIG